MPEPAKRSVKKLSSDFQSSDEVSYIALLPETPEGRTAINILNRKVEKELKKIRRNPKRSEILKEDLAYQLGYVEGLEYLKNLCDKTILHVKSL